VAMASMARMEENLQASVSDCHDIIGWFLVNQVRKVSKLNAGDGVPAPSAEFCAGVTVGLRTEA